MPARVAECPGKVTEKKGERRRPQPMFADSNALFIHRLGFLGGENGALNRLALRRRNSRLENTRPRYQASGLLRYC